MQFKTLPSMVIVFLGQSQTQKRRLGQLEIMEKRLLLITINAWSEKFLLRLLFLY